MEKRSFTPLNFVILIISVAVVLVVFASLLSSGFNLHPGLVLFLLGILSVWIGNMLSLPARRYDRRSGIKHINLFQLPAPEEYIAGNLFTARRAVSFYCFENALLLGGLIILLAGLFILF